MEEKSIEDLGRQLHLHQEALRRSCEQGWADEQEANTVVQMMVKYINIKKEIREAFLMEENSVVSIPDAEVRSLIRAVLRNEETAADRCCRELVELASSDLNIDAHLAGRPNFSYEPEPIPLLNGEIVDEEAYLQRIFDIGALVLDFDPLPSFLKDYVSQARRCYGHGFYLAVISLARVILEICLRDYQRKILENSRNAAMPDLEAVGGSLLEIIDESFKSERERKVAHRLRQRMNKVAHGSFYGSSVTGADAYQVFADTIHLIHLLYERGT